MLIVGAQYDVSGEVGLLGQQSVRRIQVLPHVVQNRLAGLVAWQQAGRQAGNDIAGIMSAKM